MTSLWRDGEQKRLFAVDLILTFMTRCSRNGGRAQRFGRDNFSMNCTYEVDPVKSTYGAFIERKPDSQLTSLPQRWGSCRQSPLHLLLVVSVSFLPSLQRHAFVAGSTAMGSSAFLYHPVYIHIHYRICEADARGLRGLHCFQWDWTL